MHSVKSDPEWFGIVAPRTRRAVVYLLQGRACVEKILESPAGYFDVIIVDGGPKICNRAMWITHSFLGTSRGSARYLFFLLYQDYIEAETRFARELDRHLERFARRLGRWGVLVRPLLGDIETTRTHVLQKSWTEKEKAELCKTPALLMINVDFDEFDPRKHPWLLLTTGRGRETGDVWEWAGLLEDLTELGERSDVNLFDRASEILRRRAAARIGRSVDLTPGVFGFSIDLREAAQALREWLRYS